MSNPQKFTTMNEDTNVASAATQTSADTAAAATAAATTTPTDPNIIAQGELISATIRSAIMRNYTDEGEQRSCFAVELSNGTKFTKSPTYFVKLVSNASAVMRLFAARTLGTFHLFENADTFLSFALLGAKCSYRHVETRNGKGIHVESITMDNNAEVSQLLLQLLPTVKKVETPTVSAITLD